MGKEGGRVLSLGLIAGFEFVHNAKPTTVYSTSVPFKIRVHVGIDYVASDFEEIWPRTLQGSIWKLEETRKRLAYSGSSKHDFIPLTRLENSCSSS